MVATAPKFLPRKSCACSSVSLAIATRLASRMRVSAGADEARRHPPDRQGKPDQRGSQQDRRIGDEEHADNRCHERQAGIAQSSIRSGQSDPEKKDPERADDDEQRPAQRVPPAPTLPERNGMEHSLLGGSGIGEIDRCYEDHARDREGKTDHGERDENTRRAVTKAEK